MVETLDNIYFNTFVNDVQRNQNNLKTAEDSFKLKNFIHGTLGV